MSEKRFKTESNNDEITPVLSDDLLNNEIDLIEVFTLTIDDKSRISYLIKFLNQNLPVPDLSHLKRVNRGLEILVYPCKSDKSEREIKEILSGAHLEITTLKIVEVPKNAPRIRRNFIRANLIWSCNFHPNLYLEKLVTNSVFDDAEIRKHLRYMHVAIDVGKIVTGNRESRGETSVFRGVVVVDPSIDSVVAIGYDNRHLCRIQHAALVAVDFVARTQNGGAWKDLDLEENQRALDEIKVKFGADVKFGARELTRSVDSPYLCTNYDIYLTHEPCVMCAMALIHSRVKRIFYVVNNIDSGAVCSKIKLQYVKDLNHHFEVFRCDSLKNQCEKFLS